MYFSQSELEEAIGGPAVLVQLLDKDGDGVADAAIVDNVIANACGDLDSAIQVRNSLPLLPPYPRAVVSNAIKLGIYLAHLKGTGGQGVPPDVRQLFEQVELWMERIVAGSRSLGAVPRATSDRQSGQVTPSADGVTRSKLKGFW